MQYYRELSNLNVNNRHKKKKTRKANLFGDVIGREKKNSTVGTLLRSEDAE